MSCHRYVSTHYMPYLQKYQNIFNARHEYYHIGTPSLDAYVCALYYNDGCGLNLYQLPYISSTHYDQSQNSHQTFINVTRQIYSCYIKLTKTLLWEFQDIHQKYFVFWSLSAHRELRSELSQCNIYMPIYRSQLNLICIITNDNCYTSALTCFKSTKSK